MRRTMLVALLLFVSAVAAETQRVRLNGVATGSGGAPTTSSYILQSADATLTGSVNLAAANAFLAFGPVPSTTSPGGGIRLTNDTGIYGRNHLNNADRKLIAINESSVIEVGSNSQNLDLAEAWLIDSASGDLRPQNNGGFGLGDGTHRIKELFVNVIQGATNIAVAGGGTISLGSQPILFASAPSIASGFGTSPSISGTANSFVVTVGTGGSASLGVVTLPAAASAWHCEITNLTATLANRAGVWTVQIATTTTSATIESQTISTGAVVAWAAADNLYMNCMAF